MGNHRSTSFIWLKRYSGFMPGNAWNSINEDVWDFTKLINWNMLFKSFIFLLCNKPLTKGERLLLCSQVAPVVKHLLANAGDMRHGFEFWVWKTPWRRKWLPIPVFLPGESQGLRSLSGYSPWGRIDSDTSEET